MGEGHPEKHSLRCCTNPKVVGGTLVPDNIGFSSYSSLIELLLETTKGYELICE